MRQPWKSTHGPRGAGGWFAPCLGFPRGVLAGRVPEDVLGGTRCQAHNMNPITPAP